MAGFNSNNTNKLTGSPGGGDYGAMGVGNSTTSFREATRKGSGLGRPGSMKSQGETDGVGSMYSVELNERPNISNPRNRGPERSPSAAGNRPLAVVGQNVRKTGRVS